jgi:hypothetical protein
VGGLRLGSLTLMSEEISGETLSLVGKCRSRGPGLRACSGIVSMNLALKERPCLLNPNHRIAT